jgi:hypothetical protein
MPAVEFEIKISAGERPQTYALDRAATGTGVFSSALLIINGQCHTTFNFGDKVGRIF